MSKTLHQIIHTSGTTFFIVAAQAITLIATARLLGPDGRGVIAAATSWIILLATVATLSLGQVILHYSIDKAEKDWLSNVVGALILLLFILSVIVIATGLGLYHYSEGRAFNNIGIDLLFVCVLTLPFYLAMDSSRYILIALDKLESFNLYQIVGHSVGVLALLAACLFGKLSVFIALICFLITHLVIIILSWVCIGKQDFSLNIKFPIILKLLKNCAKLHFNTIGTIVFAHATILLLNYYRNSSDTGCYQFAEQLIYVMLIIPNAVSTVAYGIISAEGPNLAWKEHKKLLCLTILGSLPVIFIAYHLAPFGVHLLVGEKFDYSIELFRIMLLSLPGMVFAVIMAPQWIGRGLFAQAAILTVGLGSISLIANIYAIPLYGPIGAAWVVVGLQLSSIICNGLFCVYIDRKVKNLNYEQ